MLRELASSGTLLPHEPLVSRSLYKSTMDIGCMIRPKNDNISNKGASIYDVRTEGGGGLAQKKM